MHAKKLWCDVGELMAEKACIFCKIINHEIPATIVAENEDVLVIKDIAPKAPSHYLILPKKHMADLQSVSSEDARYLSAMLFMAQQLSKKHNGAAFRLLMNNGADVGQSVFHMHMHYLSGKKMADF